LPNRATHAAFGRRRTAWVVLVSACIAAPGLGAQSIWDAGLHSGATRTELPNGVGGPAQMLNLSYTQGGQEGCEWNAQDTWFRCAGRAGLPNLPGGGPVWQGGMQRYEGCGGDLTRIGDSWSGCLTYSSSPYFSTGTITDHYWAVHVNDEPSFDQCNPGPPGLSHALRSIADPTPALFRFGFDPSATSGPLVKLVLDVGGKDYFCAKVGALQYSIPFLSWGAQAGRGNGGSVGYIAREGSAHGAINFDAWIDDFVAFGCKSGTAAICTASSVGVNAGVYGIATWGGVKRLLFIDLYAVGSEDSSAGPPIGARWNWPLADSMFYPGGDVVLMTAGNQLSNYCGIGLPRLTGVAQRVHYQIDFGPLFRCASDRGLFSAPMPAGDIALDGVHWFIEGPATSGRLTLAIGVPETSIFVSRFD